MSLHLQSVDSGFGTWNDKCVALLYGKKEELNDQFTRTNETRNGLPYISKHKFVAAPIKKN